MTTPTRGGILFWSAVYIPIVVAMAAGQNVRAALSGGPAAIVAGVAAVLACFALVPVIYRTARPTLSEASAATRADAADEGEP